MFNYLPDDKRRIVLDQLPKTPAKEIPKESSDGVQQDPLDQEKKLKQAMERELAEFPFFRMNLTNVAFAHIGFDGPGCADS
jgi:hypothetical protein